MASIASVQVILSTQSDWRYWIQTIETAAVQAEIWKYVNPDTKESELPPLEKPNKPTVQTVNPSATNYKDFSDIEREELRDLKITFKREYKEYTVMKAAMPSLVKRIQETVDRKHHYLLEKKHTAYEMITALQKRLSPTQKARERDLASAYRKLLNAPRNSELDDWLAE